MQQSICLHNREQYSLENHLFYQIFTLRDTTFMLMLSNNKSALENHLCLQTNEQSFIALFSRHVNLIYCYELKKLLRLINAQEGDLQNFWMALYEIREMKTPKGEQYEMGNIGYGESVKVLLPDNSHLMKQVSNAFQKNEKVFYFLENQSESTIPNISPIVAQTSQTLYGFTFTLHKLLLCIPLHSILSEKGAKFQIDKRIFPVLERTAYLQFQSNYCTGVMEKGNSIISTRHLLPSEFQKIGTLVNVRRFPYQKLQQAVLRKLGLRHMDLMELEISDRPFKQIHHQQKQSLKIGNKILALGFGKFSYNQHCFSEAQLVLPTVFSGNLSKLVKINNELTFFKTDANLYNGFSGCGMWKGGMMKGQLIGLAVFILKNKLTSISLNRHNFSYYIDFVRKSLGKQYEQEDDLIHFEQIHTRKSIKILPKI